MKYDKVLFVFAVLALAGSVYFYQQTKTAADAAQAQTQKVLKSAPGGEAWEFKKVPEIKLETKQWPVAQPQSEDKMWLFQLFTPPKIWVDADGKFVVQPPNSQKTIEQGFGFKFGEVRNDPYPVKYRGYFIGPDDAIMVQLYDEANNFSMIGKLNEQIMVRQPKTGKLMKSGITVKNFEKSTARNKENIIETTVKVLLRDDNLGKDILIYNDKPTFIEDSKALVLVSDKSSVGGNWEVKAVGDTRKTEDAVYTVKELDFENGFAVVEKVSAKGDLPVEKMKIGRDGNKLQK
ncbi:MAG: hypothetical protein J6P03_00960 [Opitutales bacterium]|nr:hypothetical protein [Opitutales bacterium]